MTQETTFDFKAVRRDGALEIGVVQAASREAAAALIGVRGAFPVEVSPRVVARAWTTRVSADDLATGLRALATLLNSGIPVSRALAIMSDLAPRAWLAILPDVIRKVEQGERLAAALGSTSLSLPPYVLGMISAGEEGGGLAKAVERAAQLLDNRAKAGAELRNALAYPAILATTGSASAALLVGVVLPRFAELLADAGQNLPVTTRVVLGLGVLAKAALLPLIGLTLVGFAIWQSWTRKPEGLIRWHRLLLRAPILGPIRQSACAANACAALSALLDAGVPLTAALPHAARASGDKALETRLLAAHQRIAIGASPSAAFTSERAVTQTVIGLVRLGEETGRLSEMLARAGVIESTRALQRVQRAIRFAEPTLILLFGGVVMVVAAALLQAMYSLRPG